MNRENLLSNISKHFCIETQISAENLIDKDNLGSYEANEIRNAFSAKKWKDIDLQVLIANKSALGFLSDEAFIYFLPAYMKLLILEFETADVIVDNLIEKLTLPVQADNILQYIDYKMDSKKTVHLDDFYKKEIERIDDKVHHFMHKTSLLTNEQSKIVLDFLVYIKKEYANFFEYNVLDKAINRFWFKFL